MPETWLEVARDSRKAANSLLRSGHYRSAVARAYYASYSKVAYELLQANKQMPTGREGPSHAKLRTIIITSLQLINPAKRNALSKVIVSLYTLRLYADYQPSMTVDAREAREAVSMMKMVFDLL